MGRLMCIRVLLAEDTAIMRRAIRNLLSNREDIEIVGEATTLSEAIQMSVELRPDEIIFDLHIMTEGANERLPAGPKLLAISFADNDDAKASADSIGAEKLVDKMNLSQE